jgi:hypothetical protein
MPTTTDPIPRLPAAGELSLEEAAHYLTERGYPRSASGIQRMSSRGWGGPPVSRREDGSLFVALDGIADWVEGKEATKKALRAIDEEEARILSARRKPLWHIITPFECPETDVIRELLRAYACDHKFLMSIDRLEQVLDADGPDAVLVNAYRFSVRDVSRLVDLTIARAIYCVLFGLPMDGAIRPDLAAQCGTADVRLARGDRRSAFAGAPSHLARRMSLDIGLNHEHKQALRIAKKVAGDPVLEYEDEVLQFAGE